MYKKKTDEGVLNRIALVLFIMLNTLGECKTE